VGKKAKIPKGGSSCEGGCSKNADGGKAQKLGLRTAGVIHRDQDDEKKKGK